MLLLLRVKQVTLRPNDTNSCKHRFLWTKTQARNNTEVIIKNHSTFSFMLSNRIDTTLRGLSV